MKPEQVATRALGRRDKSDMPGEGGWLRGKWEGTCFCARGRSFEGDFDVSRAEWEEGGRYAYLTERLITLRLKFSCWSF